MFRLAGYGVDHNIITSKSVYLVTGADHNIVTR